MHTIFQHALAKISRILQIEVLTDASTKIKKFDNYVLRILAVVDYVSKFAAEIASIDVGNPTQIRADDITYGFTKNISEDFHYAMRLPEPYCAIFKQNYQSLTGYFDRRYNEYSWIPPKLKWQLYPSEKDETLSVPTELKDLVVEAEKNYKIIFGDQKDKLNQKSLKISKKHIRAPLKYYHQDVWQDYYHRFESVSEILPEWDRLMRTGRYIGIRAFMFKLRNTQEYLNIRRGHDMLYANQWNKFISDEHVINLEKRLDWIFICLGHVVTIDLYLSCLIQKVRNKFDKDPEQERLLLRENAGIFKIL